MHCKHITAPHPFDAETVTLLEAIRYTTTVVQEGQGIGFIILSDCKVLVQAVNKGTSMNYPAGNSLLVVANCIIKAPANDNRVAMK